MALVLLLTTHILNLRTGVRYPLQTKVRSWILRCSSKVVIIVRHFA